MSWREQVSPRNVEEISIMRRFAGEMEAKYVISDSMRGSDKYQEAWEGVRNGTCRRHLTQRRRRELASL